MALCEGATTTLEGLVARADLNGQHVTLRTFANGRWRTQLVDSPESIRVKPSNLALYNAGLLSARLRRLSHDVLSDLAAAMVRTSQSAQSLAHPVLAEHDRVAESVFQSPDLVACVLSSFEIQHARVATVCKVWAQGWKLAVAQHRRYLRPAPLAKPAIDISSGSSKVMMASPPSGAWLCCAYNNRRAHILDPSMRLRHSIERPPEHLVQAIAAGEDRIYLSAGGNPDAASRVIAFTSEGGTTGVEFVLSNLRDEPHELALANDTLYVVVNEDDHPIVPTSRIVALNAHTLELQFTFGRDVFGTIIPDSAQPQSAVGMAVAGDALYIGRAYSNWLQVFSLDGVHLRAISGDFRQPEQVHHFNGRLYLLEEEDECIFSPKDDEDEDDEDDEDEDDEDDEDEDDEDDDDDDEEDEEEEEDEELATKISPQISRKQAKERAENASRAKRVFELSLQGETLQIWKAFPDGPNPGYPFFERNFWVYGICVMGDRLILRQGGPHTKELVALCLS